MRTRWVFLLALLCLALAGCEARPTAPRPADGSPVASPGVDAQPPASATLSFASLSVGVLHVCGVTTTGEVYCWGNGTPTPTLVAVPRAFSSVSAGFGFTCGLPAGATAFCWGDNSVGQLGNGTTRSSPTPRRVRGTAVFTYVAAGRAHTCGLTGSGAAYCWGSNLNGQLGTGSFIGPEVCAFRTPCSTLPVTVVGGLTFTEVHGSDAHTCARTADGQAYCWGYNAYGQLGDGTFTDAASPVPVVGELTFTRLNVGFGKSCGLTSDGTTYCWGVSSQGETCGPFGLDHCNRTPTAVAGGPPFGLLALGGYHICGVTPAGEAYCWGPNFSGQLGNGTSSDSDTPVAVSGGLGFASLRVNESNSCGVTTSAQAYCWGDNSNGQLGIGTLIGPEDCGAFGPCSRVPVAVVGPASLALVREE